jgi:hypothetical protein
MTPEVTFLYVPGEMIGYGRMGVYVAAELAKRGIRIYNSDGRPSSTFNDEKTAEMRGSGAFAAESPTNVICWASTPSHAKGAFEGQYRAMLTMWESMSLPEAFRDTFHEFELLMVPSWQNVELFSRYHDNVKFVPLGVDPDLWHYIPVTPPKQTFDFLINGRGKRKGVDVAYEAFQTVFGGFTAKAGQPIPRLIMKSLKGHGDYYSPAVSQVTGRLDPIPERDLYAQAHCYLQPSRGEGFGLAPLQAMALGRPTILTNAHGHESYAHLGIGLDWEPSDADYFMFGDAGQWWEPDFDGLCEAMWDVYNNYDDHCVAAHAAAEIIGKDWTWSNTTDAFLEALGGELTKPYTGSGVWRENVAQHFPVVTLKDHHMNAAGIDYQFKAGETFYVSADVKRVLYDAGLLDPMCLSEDDAGLAPEQLASLPHYLAHKSHCFTCGQELNSRPNLADKYFRLDELERENARLRKRLEFFEQQVVAGVR